MATLDNTQRVFLSNSRFNKQNTSISVDKNQKEKFNALQKSIPVSVE